MTKGAGPLIGRPGPFSVVVVEPAPFHLSCRRVPNLSLEKQLELLEELKRPASAGGRARLRSLLSGLARRRFDDAPSLIRFHEALLFLRAYPQSPSLLRQTERLLAAFKRRVDRLRDSEDFYEFAEPRVSGIAGTYFSAIFGYDITRWLAARYPSRVEIEWEGYESAAQLAAVLPRFLPLMEENAYVEYSLPYQEWLRAAKGRERSELAWLLRQFERLDVPDKERAALYESLKLAVGWELGASKASRTLGLRRPREIFYHAAPLLSRRDVSLADELANEEPLPAERLSPAEGKRLLDSGRETMSVRYRELHGFTYGDPRGVLRAEAGRGVEIFLWGVPPARRLPTLAYHAALVHKNGVPCGYAEALTLFERTEAGLNLFYTFREGESAFIYARLLRLFRQELGARVFVIEPYQLGLNNEEGVESGAFWFYRKLGFRPVEPRLARLVEREERRLRARPGYRTTARTLRVLAGDYLLFEAPAAAGGGGEWDAFHARNLGLAVARRMAEEHGGDADSLRRASVARVSRSLGLDASRWRGERLRALESLSLPLALVPDLARWGDDEKAAVINIVRAKAGPDETRYLRLMQRHARLRAAFIKLGSKS